MKVILLSIKPEWLAKILNGEKTIEVRKMFPKDYVGWVYLYCSKSNTQYLVGSKTQKCEIITKSANARFSPNIDKYTGNGKVLARFWCDNVEYIEATYDEYNYGEDDYATETLIPETLYDESCISREQMFNYLGLKGGYAIHISNLEIFDRPRELSEFEYAICPKINCEYCKYNKTVEGDLYCTHKILTKAPQNYCWVEGE